MPNGMYGGVRGGLTPPYSIDISQQAERRFSKLNIVTADGGD